MIGKFELLFGGIEIDEKIVEFVEDFLDPRIGPVDLVDDGDRGQLRLERLHQHVTRLRQRTFAGIDQKQNAVDHLQCALDLAAEIAVAGRIDDVDLHAVVTDARGLGENRDSPLPLEIVGIHDAFGDFFVGSENAALAQHGVHERRLAVVDVGDDRYVSNLVIRHNLPLSTSLLEPPREK